MRMAKNGNYPSTSAGHGINAVGERPGNIVPIYCIGSDTPIGADQVYFPKISSARLGTRLLPPNVLKPACSVGTTWLTFSIDLTVIYPTDHRSNDEQASAQGKGGLDIES
jgi:hypothetical protein